jgi:MFS family permease
MFARRRYLVAGGLTTIISVCYADRTNIGIVLSDRGALSVHGKDRDWVLSAFFVGYLCTQILGGCLATRYGAKPVLLTAAALWSTADMLTVPAAELGLGPLVLARVFMGFGEGLVFPSVHALIALWAPLDEKAFMYAIANSGQDLGMVVAPLVGPALLSNGTPMLFSFWASLALLWILMFLAFGASAPEHQPWCVASGEAEWIAQRRHAAASPALTKDLFTRLLRRLPFWGIVSIHCSINYAWYVLLSWAPLFFTDTFNISVNETSGPLALAFAGGGLGQLAAGRTCDALVRAGWRRVVVRKFAVSTGSLGFCTFVFLAIFCKSPLSSAGMLACALFSSRLAVSGYSINMFDLCPTAAGVVMGISNTLATIPGIVGQPITQKLWDSTGSFQCAFGAGAAIHVLGALAFCAMASDQAIEGDLVTDKLPELAPPLTAAAPCDGDATLPQDRATALLTSHA